jgi:Family of unknown function (DUF6498)
MASRELGRLVPGVIVNLVLLYGVVVLGWSPGSIVLLFPVESVGIGLVTVVGLCRRAGTDDMVGRIPLGALVFGAIFGVFTIVQAVFAAIIASVLGVVADATNLWLPLALVVARTAVDLGVAVRQPPDLATLIVPPITRGITLQVGVVLGMVYVTSGEPLDLVRQTLAGHPVTTAMMPVVVLMIVKTIVELVAGVIVIVAIRLVHQMDAASV